MKIAERSVSGARTSKIVVSQTIRYAARHGAVTVNPVREVGRIESTPRRRPRSLPAEERRAWLAALETATRHDVGPARPHPDDAGDGVPDRRVPGDRLDGG